MHQIGTPHPVRNPPVRADRNRVSGEAQVVAPSIGQPRMSSVSRAGSKVAAIVPRRKTGPNEPMTTAVNFNQPL